MAKLKTRYTISKLIRALQVLTIENPEEDWPVLVDGYEDGFDNFIVRFEKIVRVPKEERLGCIGDFNTDDNGRLAVIISRAKEEDYSSDYFLYEKWEED